MNITDSVLKTLLYSDIFDYPLTKEELWKFLIAKKPNRDYFDKALKLLENKRKIIPIKGFYCLYGRENIIKIRLKRKIESEKKIQQAKKINYFFRLIPSVKFVGISGSLALKNSNKTDDIDLFVICSRKRIWLTRFIMIIFLKFIGKYRNYDSVDISDKICLNMFVDEDGLILPKEKQNLYNAHEVAQLIPILNKDYIFENFLEANIWIKDFLPNTIRVIEFNKKKIKTKNKNSIFYTVELIAKHVQSLSINKRRTTEVISDNFLAFHPFNYQDKIMSIYKERLKKYEII